MLRKIKNKKKYHFTFATSKAVKSNYWKKNLYFCPLIFYMDYKVIIRSSFF